MAPGSTVEVACVFEPPPPPPKLPGPAGDKGGASEVMKSELFLMLLV